MGTQRKPNNSKVILSHVDKKLLYCFAFRNFAFFVIHIPKAKVIIIKLKKEKDAVYNIPDRPGFALVMLSSIMRHHH